MTPSQVGERAEAALVAAVPLRAARLRIGAPRNSQQRNIRWPEQYRLEWDPPALIDDPETC